MRDSAHHHRTSNPELIPFQKIPAVHSLASQVGSILGCVLFCDSFFFHSYVFDLAEFIPHPSDWLGICVYFVAALHNVDTWRRNLVVRDLYHIVIIIFSQLCYARGVNAVVHKHATGSQGPRVLNQKMSHIDHYRFKGLTAVSNDSRWLRVHNKSEIDGLNLNESWHRGHSFTYNTHVRLQCACRIHHPRIQKKETQISWMKFSDASVIGKPLEVTQVVHRWCYFRFSMDSCLEAFSCIPSDGSVAVLENHLTAFTKCLNELFLSY